MQTHFAEKRALEVPPGHRSQQLAQNNQVMKVFESKEDEDYSFPPAEQQKNSFFKLNVKKSLRNTFEELIQEQKCILKYQVSSLTP
jgi:hypothetical protein